MKTSATSLIAAVAAVLLAESVCAGDGERLRFLNEAPPSWRKYCSLFHSIAKSSVVSEQRTDILTGTTTTQPSESGRTNGRWFVTIQPDPRVDSGEQWAFGRNSWYAFTLYRAEGQAKWGIRNLDLKLIDSQQSKPALDSEGVATGAPGLNDLDSISLDQLIREPTFQLHDVNEVQVEGVKLMEVHYELNFTFNNAGPNQRNVFARKGRVRLDPNNYWLIHSAEYDWVRGPSDDMATIKILPQRYGKLRADVPVVTKKIQEVKSRPDGPKAVQLGLQPEPVRVVQETKYEVVDDSSEQPFTLSAFGLPEPVRPGIRWGWVLALILGALLLAVPAWRRHQSQK